MEVNFIDITVPLLLSPSCNFYYNKYVKDQIFSIYLSLVLFN